MDTPGIVAKTVEDINRVLSVIIGPDANDSTSVNANLDTQKFYDDFSIENCRIGIPEEYDCEGLSNEVKETWNFIASLIDDSNGIVKMVMLVNCINYI